MQSPAAKTPGMLVAMERSTRMEPPRVSSWGSRSVGATASRRIKTPLHGMGAPSATRVVTVCAPAISRRLAWIKGMSGSRAVGRLGAT